MSWKATHRTIKGKFHGTPNTGAFALFRQRPATWRLQNVATVPKRQDQLLFSRKHNIVYNVGNKSGLRSNLRKTPNGTHFYFFCKLNCLDVSIMVSRKRQSAPKIYSESNTTSENPESKVKCSNEMNSRRHRKLKMVK